MTITTTEYCQHGSHFVQKDKIMWLNSSNGGKRRICEECNDKRLTIIANKPKITKAVHLRRSNTP